MSTTMATEREESDMLTLSGPYGYPYGDEESKETPKTAGVMAEWEEVNCKLRHHGYQPVMVLPSSRLQQIPVGAVVLEEFTSKNLQNTLDKLMTDCDRRQSMVQELISSSQRIQRDADEERERGYRFEMEIRTLQKELEEEKLKTQEMEGLRLVELQRHGEEVRELTRNKSELVATNMQLEEKITQKEAEISRLKTRCQDLVKAEEKRLERRRKVANTFSKCSPKQSTMDQKVLDVIDNYESQLSEMKHELDRLRKETESHNSSVGSFGDIQSERAADSGEVSQSVNSSINVSSDAVLSSNLKGSEGEWLKDGKPGTSRESRYQAMEEKLLSAEKQVKDTKKLIKLLESENTHLKLELESRPNRDEWKRVRKYNKQLERLLAENNLSPASKRHRETRSRVSDNPASRTRRHPTHIEDIEFLPIDVCREHLKTVCVGLRVSDLRDIPKKINTMNMMAESYPPMEKLIRDIMDVISSKDGPKLSADVLSHSAISHEFHCEKAWQNIIPTLKLWLTELSGLQDLQTSINQLSSHLMPWKTEAELEQEDHTPVTIQKLKETVEVLCQDNRTSPTEIRQEEEPSVNQLKSIVAHFQKLFDITSIGGVFPRMNEVYMRLGETYNAMNNMREFLGLEPACKASDVVNAVAKLSKAKHLLKVDDLPGIIKRLDQYDEFFPAFQSVVSELKRLLRVQEMDEIVTAVTALVKFPHY
ncbi:centrosomal protein of 70 kDa-like isoform X2 [Orbicella faveolata]|uniref:centrosomal protein of 70 kDa-like isoform X2 n=1 Tax=Orbicella faveolata TaxID=48498 RepID=UPI0009E494AC|nr:centrosomal protein of 70 kDa-like isoform X2 [Orbicella faveolata]